MVRAAQRSYPERRQRVLFEREGERLHFRRGVANPGGVRPILTSTTLVLSAVTRLEIPELAGFGRAVANIGVLGAKRRRLLQGLRTGVSAGFAATARIFEREGPQPVLFEGTLEDMAADRETALALLRFVDLGIDDVQVVEDESIDPEAAPTYRRVGRSRLRFLHQVDGQQLPFEFEEESDGTQTWFSLIGPTLNALRHGRVLLFDEIDASLHPRLSAKLLELFEDPETNPRHAQLIFTSHDTSLLNHLNRDEVWLTEKDADGSTRLIALAEYGGDKVRRSLNLEKAYLQGRFGAVPEPDQLLLRQALGLER